jgi:hypothetical protein
MTLALDQVAREVTFTLARCSHPVIALSTPLHSADEANEPFAIDNFQAGELIRPKRAWVQCSPDPKICRLDVSKKCLRRPLRDTGFPRGFGVDEDPKVNGGAA